MSKIFTFPTIEDRQRVHNLINTYAQGQLTRNSMMRQIAAIIEKYNISRFPVQDYSVRILQYYEGLPIISIEGAQISDTCPCCGAGQDVARYLRTEEERLDKEYDIISQTCLECGCVYLSNVKNGRKVNRNGRVIQ